MIDDQLKLHDVIDRGKPNLERIPIFVQSRTMMGQFWLGLGVRQANAQLSPINDNLFWLGSGWVNAGDWIFVYTGRGEARTGDIPNQIAKIYSIHWNRDRTLFSEPDIHPYLLEGYVRFPPSVVESEFRSISAKAPGRSLDDL